MTANQITLENCEDEPIRTPGSVQPHGILFAVDVVPGGEPLIQVTQLSTSVEPLLGVEPAKVFAEGLGAVLTETSLDALSEVLVEETVEGMSLLVESRQRGTWLAMVHRAGSDRSWLVELEPTDGGTNNLELRWSFGGVLSRLRAPGGVLALSELAAHEIRNLTGYDRVMIYRFHDDWHGEVIAEARDDALEPFLGLHYPGSDIPVQARELYVRNWLRLIVDVGYAPSMMCAAAGSAEGEPLDMSGVTLRSVSPIHREYLTNMGVGASMSISLLDGDRLWGLIACHHGKPKFLPHSLRAICELLGQTLSWQIEARLREQRAERWAHDTETRTAVVSRLAVFADPIAGIDDTIATLTRGLVRASGLMVVIDEDVRCFGECPSEPHQHRILQAIQTRNEDLVFHTHRLVDLYPIPPDQIARCAGVVAMALTNERRRWLVWLLPEQIEEVRWGGKVDRSVAKSLTPRRSFATWREQVHHQSRRLEAHEVHSIHALQESLRSLLASQASELSALNAELRDAAQAHDDFLAMVSHEMRTPLNAVSGWLELISGQKVSRSQHEHGLEVIKRNSKRLTTLVNDLLDMARLRTGKLKLEIRDLDLAEVVNAGLDTALPAAQHKNVTIQAIIEPDCGMVAGDEERLEQVLWNLLNNAIKYTPKGGRIRVLLRRHASDVEIVVEDNGVGIPPSQLDSMFDRFHQAHGDESRRKGGLGLGLALTKELVSLHGGKISAFSEGKGKGSRFTVQLPIAPTRAPLAPDPYVDAVGGPASQGALAGIRVIIVDDDPDSLAALSGLLRRIGAIVKACASAREVLDCIEEFSPMLLLSDINMPEMDGYDLLRTLRKRPDEGGGRVAAVAITAYGRPRDRSRAYRVGFQSHITKPVDVEELESLILSLLK